jgi:hypothetical protein
VNSELGTGTTVSVILPPERMVVWPAEAAFRLRQRPHSKEGRNASAT